MIRKWVAGLTVLGTGQADVTTDEQGHSNTSDAGETGRSMVQSPSALVRARRYQPQLAESPASSSSTFDVTTMLELSLFLMLLTFFLVLTASTSFDAKRVGPVIGGIQSAFGVLSGGRLDDENDRNGAVLPVMQTGARPATGAYASEVERAFSTIGPVGSDVDGVSLNMVLQADRLFVAGSAAIKAEQRALFAEIGPLLQINEQSRHVAVLVPSAPDNRLDVRRAASLARLLLEDGAPPSQIAVGVNETGEGLVTFRFYTLPGAGQ